MGYHPIHETPDTKIHINEYVNVPNNNYYTTHFMGLKSSCFDLYVDNALKCDYKLPADCVFMQIYNQLKSFVPAQKFAYQLSLREDQKEFLIPNAPNRFKSFI